MHLAAEKGKHLRLRQFLTRDVEVDAHDYRGCTPLFLAATNGHLRCVNMLLDAKADVSVLFTGGVSTLMATTQEGYLDVVNALINAQADVNTVADNGLSALHSACQEPKNYPITAALLAAGAHVDVPAAKFSPLTAAVRGNSIESMKLLIAAGADINGSNYDLNPVLIATMYGNITAAKLLLDAKADVKSVQGFEHSLHHAVKEGCTEMTKLYISAGADVNMRTTKNVTCLHSLIASCLPDGRWTHDEYVDDEAPRMADVRNKTPVDYPGVFQVLIDAKADISARAPREITPLFIAAEKKNVEAVNSLLAVGANANDIVDNGKAVLLAAAVEGSLGAVRALIAAGADVNRVDPSGLTAVLGAGIKEHKDVVSALIAARADVNHVYAPANMTLLDLELLKSSDMVDMLKKAGAKTKDQLIADRSELVRAVSDGNIELVNKLVGNADAEEKDTALIIAVRENMLPMVKCLLVAGANPGTTSGGISMLIWACVGGLTDIVRELIDAGADITFKGENGMTAMQWAAKGKHRDIVALLLAKAKERKNTNK